jgi:glycosyltransferase involved in cell wall biosynthesis
VENFGYKGAGPFLAPVLRWLERLMINRSRVVIVICPELETTVRGIRDDVPTVLIENASGSSARPVEGTGAPVRQQLGLHATTPVALYTGTFEHYQGLDLAYGAMQIVVRSRPEAKLVLVGGEPAQVDAARRHVAEMGLADAVVFTGQVQAEEIPKYLDAATVLLSPRSSGTNTPLKIYQYLGSGRPIVATNLRTHTQVLSPDTAFLADPTAEAFAAVLLAAFSDPARAAAIGAAAKHLADTRYSEEAYMAKTRTACGLLFDTPAGEVQRGIA